MRSNHLVKHVIYQDSEQSDLVQVLGGSLAVRQVSMFEPALNLT